MKKYNLPFLSIAIATAIGSAPTTASAAITGLNVADSVVSCVIGGTPPDLCAYGATNISGSWFAMDVDGDSVISDNEKSPFQVVAMLDFNNLTPATGSHPGNIDGSESPVFDTWLFFGNTGMHYLTSPIVDNGDGTLDMTGWTATWNGIAEISMGGDPANFATDTGLGAISCGACNGGDAFTLDYASHVPLNDPSGFGGVGYALHLEGTINQSGPITINMTGGDVQECNAANGNMITAQANVEWEAVTPETEVQWRLNGLSVGNGTTFNQFVGLGDHLLQADLYDTLLAETVATVIQTFTIQDTQSPVVTAQFEDKLAGLPMSTMQLGDNFIGVDVSSVVDVCDPSPVVENVMYGSPSTNNGFFTVYGFTGGLVIPQSQLVLRVKVRDGSGNVTVENVVLGVP